MATTTTRKKTLKTKAKAARPLKTPPRPSKTPSSTRTRGTTKASGKSGPLDARTGEALLRSFFNRTTLEDEYARGGLPPAKKDGRTNLHKGRHLTAEEREKLASMRIEGPDGEVVVRKVGRPPKAREEKKRPVPFNLSDRVFDAFQRRAKERGFKTWQDWLRVLGEKDAADLLREAN